MSQADRSSVHTEMVEPTAPLRVFATSQCVPNAPIQNVPTRVDRTISIRCQSSAGGGQLSVVRISACGLELA